MSTQRHTWSLISLGSAVYIASQAFDASTQQLIAYPSRLLPSTDNLEQPVINIADKVNQVPFNPDGGFYSQAMSVAWSDSDPLRFFTHNPACPGAQCKWGPFETLSFCSSCENRAKDVILGGCNTGFNRSEIRASLGANAGSADQLFYQECSLSVEPEKYFNKYPFSIILDVQGQTTDGAHDAERVGGWWYPDNQYSALTITNGSDTKWRYEGMKYIFVNLKYNPDMDHPIISTDNATICTIAPCVKRYSIVVENGTVSTRLENTTLGIWNPDPVKDDEICWVSDGTNSNASQTTQSWPAKPTDSPYTLSCSMAYAIHEDLDKFMTANTSVRLDAKRGTNLTSRDQDWYMPPSVDENHLSRYFSNAGQFWCLGGLENVTLAVSEGLARLLRDYDGVAIPGEVLIPQTLVHVRWYWFAIPAGTVLLGSVFTLAAMWRCVRSQQALWKSSSLPFMYYGFRRWELVDETTAVTRGGATISTMEKVADRIRTQLRKDEISGDIRFTRVDSDSGERGGHTDA